jgi:hypothetical protein
MILKGFRYQAGLPLFKGFKFLKEGDEGLRIIAGLIHVLHAELVCLGFELP